MSIAIAPAVLLELDPINALIPPRLPSIASIGRQRPLAVHTEADIGEVDFAAAPVLLELDPTRNLH